MLESPEILGTWTLWELKRLLRYILSGSTYGLLGGERPDPNVLILNRVYGPFTLDTRTGYGIWALLPFPLVLKAPKGSRLLYIQGISYGGLVAPIQ